ncbi:MAG TPA: glycosyltransferase family 39 protein [Chitinophagales bacterium]|nr:glycosyltransferase family 39 protein [Chitinophagales bacterium]
MKERPKSILKAFLFSGVVYFPLFLHLENLPIRLWDESRLAMNAYEMHKNADYLVTYFQGSPDMWNTKPPLMIWLQVLCIRLFGNGELAIRLPAALAALLTCLALLLFSQYFLKSYWLGMLSVLVLVTTGGYIDVHVSRTGDYDALLILNTTLYVLLFFIFIETGKTKYLYLTFLTLMLAILTKGVAGLLFTPALVLYVFYRKKMLELLKNRHVYRGLLLVVLTAGGYYLLREYYNPGYLKAVAQNELGGRYFNTLEGHRQRYWFYFFNIIDSKFIPWYLFAPVGLLFGFFHKKPIINNLSVYLAMLILVYFFVISSGQSRLYWYDAPMFPLLSVLVAIFLWYWFDFFSSSPAFATNLRANVFPLTFSFLVFVIPYSNIINKVYLPQEPDYIEEYPLTRTLQKALKGKKNLNNHRVCYERNRTSALFYVQLLKDRGVQIEFADYNKLNIGDTVMAFQPDVKKNIEELYKIKVLEENRNLKTYSIIEVYECKN